MAQVIKCKCGSVFAACAEPYCYEDRDWQKNMRQYVRQGCTVEMQTDFKLSKCVCDEKKVAVNKNQLSLF